MTKHFQINDKVSWNSAISPIFPSHFAGTVSAIKPSNRFHGHYLLTITTELGNISVSSLSEEFQKIEYSN